MFHTYELWNIKLMSITSSPLKWEGVMRLLRTYKVEKEEEKKQASSSSEVALYTTLLIRAMPV